MPWSSEPQRPRRLVVAGAGRVGRALVRELMLRGLGDDAPCSVAVLATSARLPDAAFLVDELGDVAAADLVDVTVTTVAEEAFEGCDAAVLAASGPLAGSGSRAELFATNADRIASLAGTALRVGRDDARIAIVSNPVNALVGHVIRAHRCCPSRVSGVVGVDLARARAALARSLGSRAARAHVGVWGNHSSTLGVEVAGLDADADAAVLADVDRRVGARGAELLSTHGRTAVDSVAVAARAHLTTWLLGSGHDAPTIAAVWHPDARGALGAVPYTMPVRSDGRRWLPVRDRLPTDARLRRAVHAARAEIEQTWHELDHDRTGVEP